MERMDEEFRAHVQIVDPEMYNLVMRHPTLSMPSPGPPFESLVRIVVGQQLSVKSAASVMSNLVQALGGEVSPNQIQSAGFESIRSAGLSGAKCRCLMAIADYAGSDSKKLIVLMSEPWPNFRAELLKLRGIGPWTADMFAMSGLGLPDVFSSCDLGLRVAMESHLHILPKQKPAVYDQRALCWSPYRTMASLHLWHSLKADVARFTH